ncbi:MAG: Spy/CpxP family protein refolding chaperone [bacterium]|nr:Spy/CpxP family protein refolding chaperone [bacterium]
MKTHNKINSRFLSFGKSILVLTLILTAGLVSAQGRGPGRCGDGPGEGKGHRLEMMAKRLELTEDQQSTIKVLFENSRDEGLQKRKEMKRLRNEIKGEMLKDNPSENTVLDLNEKMGELKTEMKALRLKTRLAVRKELTDEQRDKMLVMGERGSRHGGKGKSPRGNHGKKGNHGSGCGQGNFGCDSKPVKRCDG